MCPGASLCKALRRLRRRNVYSTCRRQVPQLRRSCRASRVLKSLQHSRSELPTYQRRLALHAWQVGERLPSVMSNRIGLSLTIFRLLFFFFFRLLHIYYSYFVCYISLSSKSWCLPAGAALPSMRGRSASARPGGAAFVAAAGAPPAAPCDGCGGCAPAAGACDQTPPASESAKVHQSPVIRGCARHHCGQPPVGWGLRSTDAKYPH